MISKNDSNTLAFARIVSLLSIVIITVATYFFLATPKAEKKKYQQNEAGNQPRVNIGGEFELINIEGNLQNTKDFAGIPRLIYFGFTYCPDICPTALNLISSVLNNLDRYKFKVIPIFVTVDPERDTLTILKPYLAHFHPDILGFTGSLEQIEKVTKQYKVFFAKVPSIHKNDMNYLIDHSSFIYLLDGEANYITHFASSSSAQEITNYIRVNLINKNGQTPKN